ncbi:peptidyl-prolyl cis-trans isomerase CYP37, chloroplastic [Panicum miliaceum]|uniref:Peptidyl-prolyl cis-trans isomerase CYP37, chloroplastic n=1 Tax=Panicum miliaceum TaxID=4540 RepID=A0A3L6QMY8_PANMI|nr:peptidyl-prolyl cis-trans isomerase CYP37, chloroplastic [Panicum miliaceum]
MASRVAAMALAGARPKAHAPSPTDNTKRPAWRAQPSLNRRGRGTRGLIARASHRPSFGAEERVIQWLRSAAAALAIAAQISVSLPAEAVLYSPDTKIPRTGELALRKAIPANPNMKIIQVYLIIGTGIEESLEDISYLLRIPQRKPYGTMEGDVKKAMKIAMDNKEAILGSIPAEHKEEGAKLYTALLEAKGGLQTLLKYIKENDPDKLSIALASSLDTIGELELLQFKQLAINRLTGRGVVEFTVEKGDGSTFFPTGGGEPKSVATIQVVIDGYSAPLTAGNFAKLVLDGAYDGVTLKCASQAVIADNETGKKGYTVPLEVMPAGQFEPLYRTPLSIQDGELPVLPMSVYGAVAMAHSVDSDEYSSPTQFFFYLYDKRNSGLGGISFDEGQFSVFGYTTDGRDVLSQIKTGDKIRSAKLVQGTERLVLPSAAPEES